MKAAAFLISLIVLPVALPAQAKDGDDLSSWTLEELCERKDNDRHAEAVLAELERRDVFSASDLELVRSDTIDRGMDESALQCSWGAPDSVTQRDGDAWQTWRNPSDGPKLTVDVQVVAGRVTDIQVRVNYEIRVTARSFAPLDLRTFSGRRIEASGVQDPLWEWEGLRR